MYSGLEFFAKIIFKGQSGKIEGLENLMNSPPVIFAFNHLTPFDPIPFVLHLNDHFDKKIYFLTQREVALIFAPFMKLFGMIPASRRGLAIAEEYLKNGHPIGIFIKGAKSFFDTANTKLYPGAALLAQKTGIPVVPVTIKGKPTYYHGFWRFLFRVVQSFSEKKDFIIHRPVILKKEISVGKATDFLIKIIENTASNPYQSQPSAARELAKQRQEMKE